MSSIFKASIMLLFLSAIAAGFAENVCTTYDAFQNSQSPAFPADGVSTSATEMDDSFDSSVTVTIDQAPSAGTVRFYVITGTTPPAGVGLVSSIDGSADFWSGIDWDPNTCIATKTVTIQPLQCTRSSTSTVVTYTCTIWAMLLTPNPLDSNSYMATVTAITIPYNFDEVVDTSLATDVIGVFCGVSVSTINCVGTEAGTDGWSAGAVVSPAWLTNPCSLSISGTLFSITCDITGLAPYLPIHDTFAMKISTPGGIITVGQTVTVPVPAAISVNDSAVSLSSLPSVIGNEDELTIHVASKIQGYLTILGITLIRATDPNNKGPYSVPQSALTITYSNNHQEGDVQWTILDSVLADPTLYTTSLTIEVITSVAVNAPGALRQLRAQGSNYRVEAVTAGSLTISQSNVGAGGTTATTSTHGLSTGAIAAIAVVGALCVVALVAVGVVLRVRSSRVTRASTTTEGAAIPTAAAASTTKIAEPNPFAGTDFVHAIPMEDDGCNAIELGDH